MNRTEYIGKLNALYVGDKNCLEELITAYDEKDKEIERLKERVEDLNIINEEHKVLNGMIRKKLQKKENIIKEVREYIEENWISQKDADNYRFDDEELDIEISDITVLYDILDKENK